MEGFSQLVVSPTLIILVILSVAYLVLSRKDNGLFHQVARAGSLFYLVLYSVALVVFVFSLLMA